MKNLYKSIFTIVHTELGSVVLADRIAAEMVALLSDNTICAVCAIESTKNICAFIDGLNVTDKARVFVAYDVTRNKIFIFLKNSNDV